MKFHISGYKIAIPLLNRVELLTIYNTVSSTEAGDKVAEPREVSRLFDALLRKSSNFEGEKNLAKNLSRLSTHC